MQVMTSVINDLYRSALEGCLAIGIVPLSNSLRSVIDKLYMCEQFISNMQA